jgi:hypothetical protein
MQRSPARQHSPVTHDSPINKRNKEMSSASSSSDSSSESSKSSSESSSDSESSRSTKRSSSIHKNMCDVSD